MKGVSLLLGNDLAGDKVIINPCVFSHPCSPEHTDAEIQDTPGLYPVCAVTRAMIKKQLTSMQNSQNGEAKSDVDRLMDNSVGKSLICIEGSRKTHTLREQLIQAQVNDTELIPLLQDALDVAEAAKVPTCFSKRSGVLIRKWRSATVPSDKERQMSHQIVAPKSFRNDVLSLAYSFTLSWTPRCQ